MNALSEKILDSMSILIENNNKKLKFDKTIKCQIVNADKAQSGEYRVKYFGDSFTAYSQDVSKRYKVNDSVYVLVPENNMNNKKFITEKVTSKNDYETSLEEIEDIQKVDLVGIAWDKIYGYPTKACMNINTGDISNSNKIYYNDLLNVEPDKEFQKYSKTNNSFLLQGKFTTNFKEIPEKGNWGLRITFKYKTPTDGVDVKYRTTTYTIDHTSMTGNSYNYTNSSVQYAIFSVEGQYLLGIESIELFQEGIELKNNGSICVEDLLLQYVTPIKDYSTYSVHILTKNGIFLNERNHRQITLEAQYKYKGQNILTPSSLSNYSIYWFREDRRVGRLSQDYTKEGGIGWRKVDEDKISITIDKQDVMTSARFKLVVNYDDYWISKIIEVYYEDSTYTLDMILSQDSYNLSLATLEVVINPTSNDYSYYWMKETIDGEVEEINNHGKTLSFDITSIYQSTIFYCTIYKGDFLLGTVSKDVSTTIQNSDLEVTFIGGNTVYLYDENGDVTLETANQQKSLSFELKWKGNKVSQYSFEWILPETGRTMMTDFIYNADKTILYYKILPKFNAEKTKNTVSLIIKLNNGIEYKFDKDFIFLKQGDPGTNGTTFTTKITSTAECLIKGATSLSSMQLSITAYKDGEPVSNLGYNVSTSWSIPSSYKRYAQIDVSGSGRVTATSDFGSKDKYANVVKATTTISKGTERTVVYNYYPVIVLVYSQYRNLRISSRVKDVLYSSDGYNPSYASTTPWKVVPDISIIWKILGNQNSEMYQKDEEWLFKAPKKYLSSDLPTAVLAENSSVDYIICPIVMTLNTYGLDWINGWDGLTVDINNEEGTILAPMIGAGEKNSSNQFTGTVMGIHSLNSNTGYGGTRNGLVGYDKGVAVYGFFSDGTGFIGAADKGRIKFDGTSGTIESGNFDINEGMQIDLTKGTITAHDFKLKTGTIYMDATPSAKSNNVAIGIKNTGGTDYDGTYVFKVLHNGQLTCTGADVTGKITANSGYIGGVLMENSTIQASEIKGSTFDATTLNAITITAGQITSGILNSNVIYSGTISADRITSGTLSSEVIYSGTISADKITGDIFKGREIIADSVKAYSTLESPTLKWSDDYKILLDADDAVRIQGGNNHLALGNQSAYLYGRNNINLQSPSITLNNRLMEGTCEVWIQGNLKVDGILTVNGKVIS